MTTHSDLGEELSKAALVRELEEARIRESQMEKTVRWWTACTAGWKQKWSKVRQERDSFKRQANASSAQLNAILNDMQALVAKGEEGSSLSSKLESMVGKYRPREVLPSPEPSCEELGKEEELKSGSGSDLNIVDLKIRSAPKSDRGEDCSINRDKCIGPNTPASSKNKSNRLSVEQEKNDSLLEMMSEEVEALAIEKKLLHMDVDVLKSKKIALKQTLRVSELQLTALREQVSALQESTRPPDLPIPEIDTNRLLIENCTLRSQIRDLCYEICIAQEEIDKVSEQIIELKAKNEEFLDHKMKCVKEIERLNMRLQLGGFLSEPINSEEM